MVDPLQLSAGHNRELRHFLMFVAAVLGWTAIDLSLQFAFGNRPLTLLTAYSLPLFGCGMIWLLCRLARQGQAAIPRVAAALGIAFIGGGALFDVAVTVVKNPDLSDEANPYIRIILDSGHSLTFVYLQGLLTQAIYVALFCTFWLAFLRHRTILLDTIIAAAPRTRLDFLKAATGGAGLTWRQWLFPLKPSEFRGLYHWVWTIGIAITFGLSLLRFYVALEWLNVFEAEVMMRGLVLAGGVTGSLLLYFFALAQLYRSRITLEGEPTDPSRLSFP